MASSHCASPTRSIGAGCATPALLTRMSISPSSVRTLATSAAISNRCETSARIDTARRPCSAMSVHVSTASASRSRNVIATSAPASASARATARPMPRLPPVTSARRPASGRTGAGFVSAMCQRLLRDPRRMRVDVEAAAADEADQRDAGFLGQLDRQARRRRHRGDERHAGQPRLLQDLERRAAADEQQQVAGRQPPASSRRPMILSTALCRPTSSALSTMSPSSVHSAAACRPPVAANVSWSGARRPGSARIASASTVRVRATRGAVRRVDARSGRPHMPQEDVVVT